MHVLLTGASGSVGRFLLARLTAEGHAVTALGRGPVEGFRAAFHRFDLADPAPVLPDADALVHCALLHEPGRFRGGEGDDPDTFRTVNVEGSRRLFEAARQSGCRRAVFLSSRAVYGDHRRGETLRESDMPRPDSLYGEVKLDGERVLQGLTRDGFRGRVLRATGVYGRPPGRSGHKWSSLFQAFQSGEAIYPRLATELHGDDLAAAVSLLLTDPGPRAFDVFNASDLLLDRHDLLRLYSEVSGLAGPLPDRAEGAPGVMVTDKLKALGWAPGGVTRLRTFLTSLQREPQQTRT